MRRCLATLMHRTFTPLVAAALCCPLLCVPVVAQESPHTILVDDMVLPADFFEREGLYQTNLWPNSLVPYTFDAAVAQFDRDRMRDAMDMIEAVSAIRFVPRTPSMPDWLEIVVSNDPCCSSSQVGYQGGRQRIWQAPFFSTFGNLHELMHTLGFWHEHQRPDRDSFVTINTQNIDPQYLFNFNIVNASTFGPYDFDSVMHYRTTAFALQGQSITPIVPVPPGVFLGQRTHISATDADSLRTLYGGPGDPALYSTNPYVLTPNAPADQEILVFGLNFAKPYSRDGAVIDGTTVELDGQAVPTTVLDRTTLRATIPSSAITAPGSFTLRIRNPQPGAIPDTVSGGYQILAPQTPSNTGWFGTAPNFGETITVIGDVDGGGLRDVLVANPGFSVNPGSVSVMSPESGTAITVINDNNPAGRFGESIVEIGNVDDDANGVRDFVVGKPGQLVGSNQGQALVFRGNAPAGGVFLTINPPAGVGSVIGFGTAIELVGDLTGDNLEEIAIGAPGLVGANQGSVHIVDPTTGATLFSILTTIDSFGASLAYLGGGRLAIGAPFRANLSGPSAGYAEVFTLTATGATSAWSAAPGFANARFGRDLEPAGDINGDGVNDVAISWPGSVNGPAVQIHDGANGSLIGFIELTGTAPLDMDLANVGDVNGDGLDDLAAAFGSDIIVVAGGSSQLTQIATIPGSGLVGGWRALADGRDVFGTGARDLVAGAPLASIPPSQFGFVGIQPLAAAALIGQGCGPANEEPRLVATSRPIAGTTVTLALSNNYSDTTVSYVVALMLDNGPPVNTPAFGCESYVRPGQAILFSSVALTPGQTTPLTVPIGASAPSFAALVAQCFILVLDGQGNLLRVDASNGQVLRAGTF